MRRVAFLLCTVAIVRPQTPAQSERILEPWGGPASFSRLYVQSIDAYFGAERAYRDGDYPRAAEIIKKLWSDHPPGTREWANEANDEDKLVLSKGLHFGRPVGYYALRMLTECVNWKLRPAAGTPSNRIRLTVILVGQSSGVEPRIIDELQNGTGHLVHHALDPLFATDGSARAVLNQSLYLFGEYIAAITDGGLRLEVKILRLPNLDVPVQALSTTLDVAGVKRTVRFANLAGEGVQKIWRSVDDSTISATDWWFILYPSHVPEQYPDFAHAEFVSGGMANGPDGRSPAFLIDDRWLVRVPPHLGSGPLDEAQRRAYLPQWFQHEFFHHLYRTYPKLRLEASSHQWFDRGRWPADFEGLMEPDYYAESLQKRLKSADPPLRTELRYAPPSKELFGKLTPEMLRGKYARTPIENGWHQGVIEWDTTPGRDHPAQALRWINAAGRQWRLTPDLSHGVLATGSDNPYFNEGPVSRVFRIVLRRDADGNYRPEVLGFSFNGELYSRTN